MINISRDNDVTSQGYWYKDKMYNWIPELTVGFDSRDNKLIQVRMYISTKLLDKYIFRGDVIITITNPDRFPNSNSFLNDMDVQAKINDLVHTVHVIRYLFNEANIAEFSERITNVDKFHDVTIFNIK